MFGNLYDRALTGERCWVRHDDGRVHRLPVQQLAGRHAAPTPCSTRRWWRCATGRRSTWVVAQGDWWRTWSSAGSRRSGSTSPRRRIGLARRSGAPALRRDVFEPLPGTGRWQTVLLADGNVGLGGDPWRVLAPGRRTVARRRPLCRRIRLRRNGCRAPLGATGVRRSTVGPWFRWASVGIDCAASTGR